MSGQCFKLSFPLAAAIIIITATFSFWPSLDGDFVFDDTEAILNNVDVLSTTPLTELFQNDFWGRPVISNFSHKSYRPITVLTFRLNYLLNGLHPRGFHIFNLCLHAAVCVLLICVFNIVLFGKISWNLPYTTLYSTLLFTLHPIHAENVAGIVGRADVLCAFFFCITFILYSRLCSISIDSLISTNIIKLLCLQFPCICGTSISMLCKEQGITVLVFCVLYDVMNTIHHNKQQNTSIGACNGGLKGLIVRSCFSTLSSLALLGWRLWVMGGSIPQFQEADNPASFLPSWILRVTNYSYLYCINIWLLLHPKWLCFDWSMGCIPLLTTMMDSRLFAVVLFWIAFPAVLLCIIMKRNNLERRQLVLSLGLIVIPFLPASNLVLRVGFVVAERILYISSAGFCLLVSLGLKQLRAYLRHSNVFAFLAVVCLAIFALRSYQRSKDWQTEKRLFHSALEVCPLNAKVHYNLAKNAADNRDYPTAIIMYQEAIRLYPNYDQAMNNLANILKDQGQVHEAEDLLLKAVTLRPDFAAAWMNLGIVQSQLNRSKEAEKSYLTALTHRRYYPDCYYNLGNLYLQQKQYNNAYKAWQEAVSMKPRFALAWNNMIIMLDNLGELHKAKAVANDALQLLYQDPSIHFNLANILGKLGEFHESERHFLIATEQNRNNPLYFTNLGVLYHRWKKYSEAREAYLQALKLNPAAQSAKNNLDLLKNMQIS